MKARWQLEMNNLYLYPDNVQVMALLSTALSFSSHGIHESFLTMLFDRHFWQFQQHCDIIWFWCQTFTYPVLHCSLHLPRKSLSDPFSFKCFRSILKSASSSDESLSWSLSVLLTTHFPMYLLLCSTPFLTNKCISYWHPFIKSLGVFSIDMIFRSNTWIL